MNDLMFKVPNGQNPYSTIGRYIRDNTTTIEDMIAVIEIDGVTINELLLVDMHEDGYFVWKSDWWEGEKDISLIDFFPVSDAQKPSAQPEPKKGRWIKKHRHYGGFRSYTGFDSFGELHTITVDERTEYDDLYCSECGARSADNFLNFCPNCGADMRQREE